MVSTVKQLADALMQSEIRRSKERGESFAGSRAFDFLAGALPRCRNNTAQLAQDLWVLFETGDKYHGYFVEFGAGDGVILSNTLLLERDFGWRGILAEPNPSFHAALRTNRRAYIAQLCVAARSGEVVSFLQTADPHLAATAAYAFVDMHAELRRGSPIVEVETVSLNDLLHRAEAPRRIDYLSVDTEGSEFDILSAFDFDRYDVHLLTVEHNHTDREVAIDQLLAAHGFERLFAEFTDFDAWYVNTAAAARAQDDPTPRRGLWRRVATALTQRRRRNIDGGRSF